VRTAQPLLAGEGSIDDAVQEEAALHEEQPEMMAIAVALWQPDYGALFDWEYESLVQRLGPGYLTAPSSYAQRLRGRQLEQYQQRMRSRQRDQMAIALHSSNMRLWTPSLLARSVTYFSSASSVVNETESRGRRLASRPSTLKFLRMMRDVRPPADFEVGRHVAFYVADQTYQ